MRLTIMSTLQATPAKATMNMTASSGGQDQRQAQPPIAKQSDCYHARRSRFDTSTVSWAR